MHCCVALQEGDPYPEWPDDVEVPQSQSEVQFRLGAAETIKARGNELFKQVQKGYVLQQMTAMRGPYRCHPVTVAQLASKRHMCNTILRTRSPENGVPQKDPEDELALVQGQHAEAVRKYNKVRAFQVGVICKLFWKQRRCSTS